MLNLPKRWRFQIHLITAIWRSLAAGMMIWATTRGGEFGWPYRFYQIDSRNVILAMTLIRRCIRIEPPPQLMDSNIAIDGAVALEILAGVWFVSEGWIGYAARRQARNSIGE